MSNIDKAKSILSEGCTCVLVGDGMTFRFNDTGIAPLLNVVKDGTNVTGFALADKIVGKAVAMLAIKLGISEVYAGVISESAISFLSAHNVPFTYNEKVKYIVNRKGDGECPMEETVKDIDDIDLGIEMLIRKLSSLKNNSL